MYELLMNALAQLHGAWRFRWRSLALAWCLMLLGVLVVYVIPDRYEVRARVYVDTESVLKPLLAGLAVNTPVMTQVNMMTEALLSQPQLEKVARDTDLYLRAASAQEMQELLEQLRLKIRLDGGGRDNLYQITYEDTDRAMAYRIVKTLLDSFVDSTLGVNREDSDSAQRFLESQIAVLEQRLREAEDRRAEFKRKNVGLMPGERGDYYTRLQEAMESLEELESKQALLVTRRDQLERQLDGEQPTFGILTPQGSSGGAHPLDARISQIEGQITQLLLRFTEKHPDVIALREQIAQLEAQRDEELRQGGPLAGNPDLVANKDLLALNSLDLNPVYQRMKIAHNDTVLELAEMADLIAAQRRVVNELRSLVDTIPEVEAEITRLDRDYDVTRAQHTALLQRLESARLSEQAERDTEKVTFRILEPPALPLLPVGPNRPLLLVAVLVFALGAGGALAFFFHQINPVFSTRVALRERLGVPVLGVVPRALTPAEEAAARQRRRAFGLGIAGLVAVFVIAVALLDTGVPALRALLGGGAA